MSLYEATWPDAPSILLSSSNTGEALRYISQEFGQRAVFQLEDLVELQPENFILVRRCGALHTQMLPQPMRFCPNSSHRAFLVKHIPTNQQAAFAVHQLQEFPPLILWHFEMLSEAECQNYSSVRQAWEANSDQFSIHELDTETPGILIIYNYCCCPPTDHVEATEIHSKNDLD